MTNTMRRRSFLQRNRRVPVWELTDLVALRPGGPTRGNSSIPGAIAARFPSAQVTSFEDAGWIFQSRSSPGLPHGALQSKVFLKRGPRVMLGTNLLTVKLPDDPAPAAANAVLRPFGCRVTERLTFAPGLFQVMVTDRAHGDTLDVAAELINAAVVEFAEPVFIEVTGSR